MVYICGFCDRNIHANANAIECSLCKHWYHANCVGLNKATLQHYVQEQKKSNGHKWLCENCQDVDNQTDINVTLGSQIHNVTEDARIEAIFVKHFSSFKTDLLQSIETCTAGLTELKSRVAELEMENRTLKECLANIKVNGEVGTSQIDELYTIEKSVRELEDRNKRKCNLIIYGIPENAVNDDSNRSDDENAVKDAIRFLLPDHAVNSLHPKRLGKYDRGKRTPRPLKITLENEKAVFDAIKKGSDLKKHTVFSGIYISSDKTILQRTLYRMVKEDLQKRTADGEEGLKIRYISGIPTIVRDTLSPDNQEN